MTLSSPGGSRWIVAIIIAVGLVSAAAGLALGALLIPRTEIVEKPVEILVEKRVEVPVERKVVVERKVELPPAPFRYSPAGGGSRQATEDEIRVALLMRDDIRKADLADKICYETTAIFNPGKSVKVLVNLNDAAATVLSAERIKQIAVDALSRKGFEVLSADDKSSSWNTLVHVEVDLTEDKYSGRVAVTLRQSMLGFSNLTWRKVSVGSAHYVLTKDFGRTTGLGVNAAVDSLTATAARDLAAAK
jgi:hypothetical protein